MINQSAAGRLYAKMPGTAHAHRSVDLLSFGDLGFQTEFFHYVDVQESKVSLFM